MFTLPALTQPPGEVFTDHNCNLIMVKKENQIPTSDEQNLPETSAKATWIYENKFINDYSVVPFKKCRNLFLLERFCKSSNNFFSIFF